MSTFREILYMIQDECKFDTDDSFFTHEHILFLMSRYRASIFKQMYGNNNIKKPMPSSAKQEICIELMPVSGNEFVTCESGIYLRSTRHIPDILPYSKPQLYTDDIYSTISHFDLIYFDRMKYVGENKWFKNIIYASISPDKYLYLKSQNPVFVNLEKIRMNAIFENIEAAAKLSCNNDCDILDTVFPIEEALMPALIQSVVQELLQKLQVPEDKSNNADDNQNENMYANGAARPTEQE